MKFSKGDTIVHIAIKDIEYYVLEGYSMMGNSYYELIDMRSEKFPLPETWKAADVERFYMLLPPAEPFEGELSFEI